MRCYRYTEQFDEKSVSKQQEVITVGLMTKEQYEEYINRLSVDNETHTPQWSEPVYTCPKCGGGMRKNLWTCRTLTCNPPITEYEYRCDNEECNNIEYLRG